MRKMQSTNDMPERESSIAGLEITESDESLRIVFSIKRTADVNLSLFDSNGGLMATLVKGPYPEGSHTVTCENKKIPQGACFILLEAGDSWVSKKIVTAG